MKWIEYLEKNNIAFNIHILEKNDSFVFYKNSTNKHFFIIINGLIKLINIFTNGEIICSKLLYKANTIPCNFINPYKEHNNYYKAKALIKTAILSIPLNKSTKFYIKNDYSDIKLSQFIELKKQNIMIQILCHRNTKKRIIHLLLILAKEFGHLKNYKIIIPFYISHYDISIITGSQRTNVTRIMNYFKQTHIISYTKQYITINNLLKLIQK